jgi:hypothetical protein
MRRKSNAKHRLSPVWRAADVPQVTDAPPLASTPKWRNPDPSAKPANPSGDLTRNVDLQERFVALCLDLSGIAL